MQTGILDTACVHDCEQANSKNPSCAVIMPTKRSEPLEVVQERDATACQLCDTVCITDWGSLDQTCIDSCEQRRTANRCAVLERQVTLPQPVVPDPNCIDCDTACTNMTSSSSYYDCLVGCESKNSAHCGHTPKRRVSSAV
ncbi:hypothetical protein Tdes44962_MAKER02103 [Teratosphaeria destructans]|uniref:Uncharacterized protein n=1 Tax=Teratosphaeria destructans TaxID=418781 RepID=A0A9W7SUX6_9PEZI|nr:hypothetical protein Tdes44962_MAKER02103 [Teratosphaeria destructans]